VAFSGDINVAERVETAQFLISKGANIKAKTNEGNTPIDLAIDMGCEAMVQYLKGVNSSEKNWLAALLLAIFFGTIGVYRFYSG
jgi:ankyrin repeat protein